MLSLLVQRRMGRLRFRVGQATLTCVAALALVSAIRPGGLASARPGLWEVSHSATGANAERVCLADLALLAQWEHRQSACARTQIGEDANRVTFQYQCAGGGFGRSDMTLLTPRALRVETQGISGGLPFAYVLHARRLGNCDRR